MVGVEPPTPIGARLAARGLRPRRVSAKRSWPPRCGRFPAVSPAPEVGGGEKAAADGVVDGRADDAPGHSGIPPVACKGYLPHGLPTPEVRDCENDAANVFVKGIAEDAAGHTGISPTACNGCLPHAPPSLEVGDDVNTATDGLVEDRAEDVPAHTGISPPACNRDFPHLPQPEPERVVEELMERKEHREPQPQGDEALHVRGEIRAINVMPLAFAAPQSIAACTKDVMVNGGCGSDSLPVDGQGDQGSVQLVREENVTGGAYDQKMGSSEIDDELERKEDSHVGGRKKIWLTSVMNLPPKRRAVSAIRKYPPGCGRTAVTVTNSGGKDLLLVEAMPISFARLGATGFLHTVPISGCSASLLRKDAANEQVECKRANVEGGENAQNTNQETQVVNSIPDDFTGDQHDHSHARNVITKDSPKRCFTEKMDGKRSLHGGMHAYQVAHDGQVTRNGEGNLREGTPKTRVRGLVDVKAKGKGFDSGNMETWLDDVGGSREGTMKNKALSTERGVGCSNVNLVARKLKRDAIGNESLNRSPKASKRENRVATNRIVQNDDLDLGTTRQIVQALMTLDKCPWTQGKKSIASVSLSHTPRSKLKKKVAPLRKVSPPKMTPSTSTKHETRMDKEDSFLEDDDDSLALVVNRINNELCVIPPSCAPFEDQSVDAVNKLSSKDDDDSLALVVHESKDEFCVNLPPCAPFGDQSTDARSKVRRFLKVFQLICRKLRQAEEQHIRVVGRIDTEAANMIKKSYPGYTKLGPIVGNVPGVEVGDEFQFRVELSLVGIHRPLQGGIDISKVNGITIAISIVSSGGYSDQLSSSGVLIYTGSGGKAIGNKEAEDQKLRGGNLGLKNCIETKTPVRVIHGFKGQNRGEVGQSKSKQISTYTYDGLYVVEEYWQEGERGSMVFKYKLRRILGQPELALHVVKETKKSKVRQGLCLPDISQGNESIPVCVINTIDDTRPAPFKYITQVIYPSSYAKDLPQGCDCTNGCSDSNKCACAVKNGGEIPFNFNGAIVQAKPLIYECGPSCRCPPTCHNRVSQHGVKIPLEIFKAGKTGWGVRSLSSIASGSFICEYTGEVLQDTEAEKTENDEYLFDIGRNYDDEELWKGLPAMIPGLESSIPETMEGAVGLTIDAAKCGNVGRFINHSCSPNLYAQNVLWDHDDKRMPHIMFFAAENIPPLQELTYHYNYTIGQVRDSNNEEKEKKCLCGAPDCCGRLY